MLALFLLSSTASLEETMALREFEGPGGVRWKAWDVTAGARSLRVPILIAQGRYDYTVPYVLWEGIAAQLPRATLRIFEHSGHQPFFEEPDEFASALTDWMASQP